MSKNLYQLILLAGGTGSRMNLSLPKQFLKIQNQTLIQRSLRIFQEINIFDTIVIVSHKDSLNKMKQECKLFLDKNTFFVIGGKTRHTSFLNGMKKLKFDKNDIILIQDVVRPFVNREDIKKTH